MRIGILVLASAVLPALASSRVRADDAVTPVRGVVIGDAVPPFEAVDVDGVPFSLATARTISEADALAAVLSAAKGYGGGDAKADTAIASLTGMLRDGKLDPAAKTALVQAAWRQYGLIASDA